MKTYKNGRKRNKNQKTKSNKHRMKSSYLMKGGSLTGNQLRDLFTAQYNYDNNKAYDFFPLIQVSSKNTLSTDQYRNEISNNNPLYSQTFTVFINNNFNAHNIHLVAVHKGTFNMKDWGNNAAIFLEKFTFHLYDQTKTKRSVAAYTGTQALINYLLELFVKISLTEKENIILDALNLYKNKIVLSQNYSEDKKQLIAVREFLRNHLSTIGHSQGAIYAYLNGSIGRETIVFNPAPFNYEKPSNCTIIRIKGDPVSIGTTVSKDNNKLYVLPNKTDNKTLIGNHSTETLNGIFDRFGDLFTGTKDNEEDVHSNVVRINRFSKSDIFNITTGRIENSKYLNTKEKGNYVPETEQTQIIEENNLQKHLNKLLSRATLKIRAVNTFADNKNKNNYKP